MFQDTILYTLYKQLKTFIPLFKQSHHREPHQGKYV